MTVAYHTHTFMYFFFFLYFHNHVMKLLRRKLCCAVVLNPAYDVLWSIIRVKIVSVRVRLIFYEHKTLRYYVSRHNITLWGDKIEKKPLVLFSNFSRIKLKKKINFGLLLENQLMIGMVVYDNTYFVLTCYYYLLSVEIRNINHSTQLTRNQIWLDLIVS